MKLYQYLIFTICFFSVKANYSYAQDANRNTSIIITGDIKSLRDARLELRQFEKPNQFIVAYGDDDVDYTDVKQLMAMDSANNIFQQASDGHFKFIINCDSSKMKFLSLSNTLQPNRQGDIFSSFFFYPGDSLYITEVNGHVLFSGNRSMFYQCQYELLKHPIIPQLMDNNPVKMLTAFRYYDSSALNNIRILDNYKKNLDVDSYLLLKGQIISYVGILKTSCNLLIAMIRTGDYSKRNLLYPLLKDYHSPIWNDSIQNEIEQSKLPLHYLGYLDLILSSFRFNAFLENKPFSVDDCYKYIVHRYTGNVREYLIYLLVNDNYHYLPDQSYTSIIKAAFKSGYIKNFSISEYLKHIEMDLAAGKPAYNFALPDTSGKIVHLSDFRGKVVLMDTWFLHCGACARIHPIIDSIRNIFKGKMVLVSVYLDYAPRPRDPIATWKKAIHQNIMTSPENENVYVDNSTGKDPDVCRYYGIYGGAQLILVDKKGNLMKQCLSPGIDNGADIINKVKSVLND